MSEPLIAHDPERAGLDDEVRDYVALLGRLLPSPLWAPGAAGLRALVNDLVVAAATPEPYHRTTLTVPVEGGEIDVVVLRPSDEPDLPVLVWLHGGGWTIGSVAGATPVARALVGSVGCAVAMAEYRLAPEHPYPTPLRDCIAAYRSVLEHADELGIDPARIALGGDSAGGNLATAVTLALLADGEPAPHSLLMAYPVVEWGVQRDSLVEFADAPALSAADCAWYVSNYLPDPALASDPLAMPANAESLAGLPPSMLVLAEFDPLRDEGLAFAERLRSEGVDTALSVYPGVYHGFFTEIGLLTKAQLAVDDAGAWLRARFGL